MKSIALIAALAAALYPAQASKLPDAPTPEPIAVATIADADYCFGRVRGLDPGRLPPAYLVLELRVNVSYRNPGARPLLLTAQSDRTVYTSLKHGAMTVFKGPSNLFEPSYKKMMMTIPPGVSPDNPVDPKNLFFAEIPAGGAMAPIEQLITMPINRKFLFKPEIDLRGATVYFVMQFAHREISPILEAELSDRWAKFGVPWTGVVRTNTFAIDVPKNPVAQACYDSHSTTQ